MKKGVFAGSFDPVTLGHIDVIERALGIFDEIHVLVGDSMSGKKHMFDSEKRLEMLRASVSRFGSERVKCCIWHGPLFEYCLKAEVRHIVKGVRTFADFEYEKLLALQTKALCPDVETVLLLSSPDFEHISSSYVKGLINYGMSLEGAIPSEIIGIISENK